MENIRKRILIFIDSQNISNNVFLKETGLKKGYVDTSLLKSEVKESVVARILESFPEINPMWLLMGKGEMLLSEAKEEEVERVEDLKAHIADLRAENEFLKEQIRELNKKRPAQEDAECADAG